jgi:hypothetical protein
MKTKTVYPREETGGTLVPPGIKNRYDCWVENISGRCNEIRADFYGLFICVAFYERTRISHDVGRARTLMPLFRGSAMRMDFLSATGLAQQIKASGECRRYASGVRHEGIKIAPKPA